MRTRDQILSLIPHQGAMCLLDEVVTWDQSGIRCRTRSHLLSSNPLRSGGRLRAVHLCEYAAQAMAIHGGLVAQGVGEPPRPGLLVSLRAMRIECASLESLAGFLDVSAEVLLASGDSWQYSLSVEHGGRRLASGRAAVMLLPRATSINPEPGQ